MCTTDSEVCTPSRLVENGTHDTIGSILSTSVSSTHHDGVNTVIGTPSSSVNCPIIFIVLGLVIEKTQEGYKLKPLVSS